MGKQFGSVYVDDRTMKAAMAGRAEGANYNGSGDTALDFGKANSFIDEDNSGKRFSVKLANSGESDITVSLNSIIGAIAGATVLAEGTVAEILTVTGTPRSYDVLRKYVENHPTRIRTIKLNVDREEQLDEPLVLVTETPFASQVEEQRTPSDYQSQDTNNPKMSEVKDINDWVLGASSTIKYTVRAGRTVNLSILFGASFDEEKAVNKKAAEAAYTVATVMARAGK